MFQKLVVYQEGGRFACEILRLTANLKPRHYALGDQLRRAAMSISANIAEGWGRRHPKEKLQFYRVAMASAYECVPHLEFAFSDNLILRADYERLLGTIDRIILLLNGLLKSTQSYTKSTLPPRPNSPS